MTDMIQCPGCEAKLRIRPEYAGKRIKCPRCKTAVSVPAAVATEVPLLSEVEPVEEEKVTAQKPKRKAPPVRPRSQDDDDEDLGDESLEDAPTFQPCPQCNTKRPKRVMWTAWGSFYGPALFNHVRCRNCGYTYNGKTGRSNTLAAVIFVTIPTILILGILAFVGYILYQRYNQ